MEYIENDFTDALIDAVCGYVVLNDESYVAYSKGSKLIWK